jgi:hypothetical protein
MPEERVRKLFYLVVATFLLLFSVGSNVSAADPSTGIMIPLYTYPGATWDQTISAKAAHPSVPIAAIVNPSNGPGYSKDSNYEAGIQELKEAGVIVLGYVSTAYTNRDLNSVKSDIDSWKSWYPEVQGIFLDEQTNWSGPEWYYDQADEYAKSKGFTMTVGNPGANSIPSYLDTVDVVLIYESPGLPDLGNYQGWSAYPNNKLGMIPFSVSSMPDQWVQDASSIAGWIYVTDDALPNPWDSLPAYFEELVAAVDSPTEQPQEHSLTIRSVDQNGDEINGMWMEIEKNGVTIQTGFTPMTLSLEPATYDVTASNYQQIIFDSWSDGTELNTMSLILNDDTTVTAHYENGAIASVPEVALTIKSVDQNGNPINGLWTEITDSDGTLETGFTPMLHSVQADSTYKVAVADYQNYIFDHWQDTGSTARERDIAIQQDTELYAVYHDTSLADAPSEPDPPADDPVPANTFTLTQEGTTYVRKSSASLAKGVHTIQVVISGHYDFDGEKLTIGDPIAGVLVLADKGGNEMSVNLNVEELRIYKQRYIIYEAELEGDNSGYVYGKLRFNNLEADGEQESKRGSSKAKMDGTRLVIKKISGSIEFT